MLICFIIDDVNLDNLVRMVSATVLCCKVTTFPFGIDKYLEMLIDYANTLFLLKLLLTNLRIYWWILPTSIISVVFAPWRFGFSLILSIF